MWREWIFQRRAHLQFSVCCTRNVVRYLEKYTACAVTDLPALVVVHKVPVGHIVSSDMEAFQRQSSLPQQQLGFARFD